MKPANKGWRIFYVTVGAVLAVFIALVLILGLIKTDTGLKNDSDILTVRVSKKGFTDYNSIISGQSVSFSADVGNDAEAFDKLVKEFKGMTRRSLLTGILEGRASDKAHVVDRGISAEELRGLAVDTAADEQQFVMSVLYKTQFEDGAQGADPVHRTVTMKDANGKDVTFAFDTVTFLVEHYNLITEVRVFAYLSEYLDNPAEFDCVEVAVFANQARLNAACKAVF